MKKITILLIGLLVSFSSIQAQTAVAPASGNGNIDNPYQIATLDNLYWLTQQQDNSDATGLYWSRNYIQTANIDATTTNTWDTGAGFSPIGNITIHFTGSYNGQEHIIEELYIYRPDVVYVGLFGYIENSIIENLGISNINLTGENLIGGIAGASGNSTINNCFTTGTLTNGSGNSRAGGLIGVNTLNVNNCYSIVDVNGNGTYSGGLIALNSGIVSNCYSVGLVTGTDKIGGLIGENSGTITNSFWDIDVFSTDNGVGIGKTTAEMQTLTTFTDATWDFTNETVNGTEDIWEFNNCINDYPTLSWQKIEEPTIVGGKYQIATLCDLRWLSETPSVWSADFEQTANIDATETNTWNSGLPT